ncbi:tripartite tricarboxylate transporter substrate binding protein [Pusillimonas sp. MFBS29]|uniref:Bug family tripartite tricarboxylate transporter substrate binding protein n=1 Tax=Pusillimonas sp. MFBS29 TaxID=2886690 RepID=UPI001D1037A8|nr:tripartite tricarboxylate transporter substrate binding protein [Pusillimonas sp. MFBS29]MCC2596847.1 tripartite tricarboxylate transporter substrate binding protein [Pusillimonas sp. MFBS29]
MLKILTTLLCSSILATSVQAAYPDRSITLVVPYPVGGSADTLARLVAEGLSQRYDNPIVVENRGGAGGHIGAEQVLKAPADGYTMMLGTIAHNGAFAMYKNLRYNPATDLVPVAMFAEAPNVLIVPKASPFKSVQDLLDAARANPSQLNYGSAGVGSGTHMAAELFKYIAKVDITPVPFRGGAPALTALLGGQVDLNFETGVTATKAVDTGKVRPLAVTGKNRSPAFPDLPTIAEAGVSDYFMTLWYTISVAQGVPADIQKKLNADINEVVKSPEFSQRMNNLGVDTIIATQEEAIARNEMEAKRWTKVIKAAGIELD